MGYRSFEDLEVWKNACQLAVEIYSVLRHCKDYSYRDQMQKSAISIPSNIAEGAERGSTKDFIRFLHIAKGSAGELRTQLYIAEKVKIINSNDRVALCDKLISISKMLQSLISSLSAT
jgi:four helix bundle protein